MNASWADVATLVLKLVAREPPFVQILFVVGLAFSFVMVLEGLRVNFLPTRKGAGAMLEEAQRSSRNSTQAPRQIPRPQPLTNKVRNPAVAKPHRAFRPTIRKAQTPKISSGEQAGPPPQG